jgi:hypothetical protein
MGTPKIRINYGCRLILVEEKSSGKGNLKVNKAIRKPSNKGIRRQLSWQLSQATIKENNGHSTTKCCHQLMEKSWSCTTNSVTVSKGKIVVMYNKLSHGFKGKIVVMYNKISHGFKGKKNVVMYNKLSHGFKGKKRGHVQQTQSWFQREKTWVNTTSSGSRLVEGVYNSNSVSFLSGKIVVKDAQKDIHAAVIT